jgi:tetratricopeptide (TPR) repeat protein
LVTQDKPADLAARLARARYYLETNRRTEAQADIRYAFEKLPDGKNDPDVVLAHADAMSGVDLNEARSVLQTGLANRPNHPTLTLGLAEVESRAGRRAEAVQLLSRLADGLPDADPALADVADRLFDLTDPTATAVAKRATEAPSLRPLAGYFDGRAKLAAGDWPAALPLLSKAVTDIANTPQVKRKQVMRLKAQLGVASCNAQSGDVRGELAAFQEAVKIDGASIPARLGVADALVKLNRPDEAAQVYRGIELASPAAKLAAARAKLADALRQPPTNPRRFDAFWDNVGRTGPYPAELLPLVANAHLAGGDVAKVEQLLDTAIRGDATAQVYVALAAVRSAKSVGAAVEVLDAAEKKLGATPEVRPRTRR